MDTEAKTGSKVWETPVAETIALGAADIICTSGIDAPTRGENGTGDKSTWGELFGENDEP